MIVPVLLLKSFETLSLASFLSLLQSLHGGEGDSGRERQILQTREQVEFRARLLPASTTGKLSKMLLWLTL